MAQDQRFDNVSEPGLMQTGVIVVDRADEPFTEAVTAKEPMANVTLLPERARPVDIAIQLKTVDEASLTAKARSITLLNAQPGFGRQIVEAIKSSDANGI